MRGRKKRKKGVSPELETRRICRVLVDNKSVAETGERYLLTHSFGGIRADVRGGE